MKLDPSHPWNVGLVRELAAQAKRRRVRVDAIAAPKSVTNPYWELGSSPEVVERLWDVLGARLSDKSRAIVYGVPGLVDPGSGAVLALAYRETYVLRVPNRRMEVATQSGCAAERSVSDGSTVNIERSFGRGWLFGCGLAQEVDWVAEAVRDLRLMTGRE